MIYKTLHYTVYQLSLFYVNYAGASRVLFQKVRVDLQHQHSFRIYKIRSIWLYSLCFQLWILLTLLIGNTESAETILVDVLILESLWREIWILVNPADRRRRSAIEVNGQTRRQVFTVCKAVHKITNVRSDTSGGICRASIRPRKQRNQIWKKQEDSVKQDILSIYSKGNHILQESEESSIE